MPLSCHVKYHPLISLHFCWELAAGSSTTQHQDQDQNRIQVFFRSTVKMKNCCVYIVFENLWILRGSQYFQIISLDINNCIHIIYKSIFFFHSTTRLYTHLLHGPMILHIRFQLHAFHAWNTSFLWRTSCRNRLVVQSSRPLQWWKTRRMGWIPLFQAWNLKAWTATKQNIRNQDQMVRRILNKKKHSRCFCCKSVLCAAHECDWIRRASFHAGHFVRMGMDNE